MEKRQALDRPRIVAGVHRLAGQVADPIRAAHRLDVAALPFGVRGWVEVGCLALVETEIPGVDRPGTCLLYTSPSPRDRTRSRMPSSA